MHNLHRGFLFIAIFISMISLYDILINEATTSSEVEKAMLNAIRNKRTIAIYYKGAKEGSGGWRKGVVPVMMGIYNGKKYIRAWQRSGKTLTGTPQWKLFRLDRIRNWNIASKATNDTPPGPNFNPNGDDWNKHIGKGFERIIAISKY